MEALYILSDPDSIKAGKYKVGITKRNKNNLLRDYRRSRPEVNLFFFEKCENSKIVESMILEQFSSHRVLHESGRPSEWIHVSLPELLQCAEEKMGNQRILESSIIDTKIKLPTGPLEPQVTIDDFLNACCVMKWENSESCTILYNHYLKMPGVNKLNFLNFCKQLTKKLLEYHKCPKTRLKYKQNKMTYYRGIQLKINIIMNNGWSSCIIL